MSKYHSIFVNLPWMVWSTIGMAQQPAPIFEVSWTGGTQESFSFGVPTGVVVTSGGNVVALANGAIWVFDECGEFRDIWPLVTHASAIAVGPADTVFALSSFNYSVRAFELNGSFLYQWGTQGTGEGQFQQPSGIAVSPDGSVYVTDSGDHLVKKFSASGEFQFDWGGYGSTAGFFEFPRAIAVDDLGNVFVADSALPNFGRIQKFDADGNFLLSWHGADFDANLFFGINALATDSLGNVYVCDSPAPPPPRVWKFDAAGRFVTQWRGEGIGGTNFSSVYGVAVDSAGTIYVADAINGPDGRIHKFIQPYVQECPSGDLDGDCDVDAADFVKMTWSMTGPLQPAVVVDAGCLTNAASSSGSYFSNGNDLHGYATQQGYDVSDWAVAWTSESKPVGAGNVAIFDPAQLESEYVVTAPAVAGDYTFRLTVSNPTTGGQATDTVTLTLTP